jgi:hypothetical protein
MSRENTEVQEMSSADVGDAAAIATPVEKFPEMRALMTILQKERAAIVEVSAPLREAREKLRVEMEPLETQLRELNAQIKRVEMPRLFDIDNQIGALAKAMGGRSMQQPKIEEA